jgi:hypothetical protein
VEEREEKEEEEEVEDASSLAKAPACRHSRLQNLPARKWGSPQEEEEEEKEEEAHRRKRRRKPFLGNQTRSPAGRLISGGAPAADPASVVNRSQYNFKEKCIFLEKDYITYHFKLSLIHVHSQCK